MTLEVLDAVSTEDDLTPASPASDENAGSNLDREVEALWRRRRDEILNVLDGTAQEILREVLRGLPRPGGEPLLAEVEALQARRQTLLDEVEHARAELDSLRQRAAVLRRDVEEIERRKAVAEEEHRSWQRKVESERQNLLASTDGFARSVLEFRGVVAGESLSSSSSADRDGETGADPETPVEETREVTVRVSNLANLAEAMRLRGTLRQVSGVRSVSFPRFHDGTMTLTVRHSPTLDLAATFGPAVDSRLVLLNRAGTADDVEPVLEFRLS